MPAHTTKPKQSLNFVWVLLYVREDVGFAVASSFEKRATDNRMSEKKIHFHSRMSAVRKLCLQRVLVV